MKESTTQTKNAIPQSDHSDCFPPRVTPFVWLCCAATPAAAGALITNVTAYAWAAHAALLTLSKISFVTDLSTSTCVPQTICPALTLAVTKLSLVLLFCDIDAEEMRNQANPSRPLPRSMALGGVGGERRGVERRPHPMPWGRPSSRRTP
jgi:hypothetical protein